jgi:hypothetical protein
VNIYYYAFSGHKWGLDRVKRGVALIKALRDEDIEVQLLVSDFRAGLAAKDLGVSDAITIETIMDIDMVAKRGDILFVDTPEEDHGRIDRYSREYKYLFHIVDDFGEESKFGEVVVSPDSDKFSSILIDREYYHHHKKVDRVLFFLGDADYDKEILSHSDFFAEFDMELLLGHYFFVKYEDKLSKMFLALHEAEEYSDTISSSSVVVTCSKQTALEAKASCSDVIYMRRDDDKRAILDLLGSFGIKIIEKYDRDMLSKALNMSKNEAPLPKFIDTFSKNLLNEIIL